MTRPGTFERVYAALKAQLRSGAFKPGDRLEPAALSERLNASVTPVRDALHRLTGERMVEAPRHEGFKVPMMTETMLRHLYAWHLDLLLLAVAKRREGPAVRLGSKIDVPPGASTAERTNSIFRALGERSGNPEHLLALQALTERLGFVQRLEEALLDAVEAETEQITSAIRSGDRKALRKSLVQYHRRRQRIVPELLSQLYSS